MTDRIDLAGRAIADADTAAAMTGAGVSTASGIPDFRGDGGLWERYDQSDFSIHRFERDPAAFWDRWVDLRAETMGGDVAPNPAHDALANLHEAGHLSAVVTQNVDGLHQAAGVPDEDVYELHGTADRVVCRACRRREDAESAHVRARDGERPPRCRECDGTLKPDSVLFGEQLPEHALYRAHALAERSDAVVVAGSSLTVEPAASLPRTAADRGATLVVVNLEPTPLDDRAEYVFREDVTEVLPALAAAAREAE